MSEFKIIALVLLVLWCGILSANGHENISYQELDRKIVKAYNHNPRNTADVYVYSRLILEKANKDSTTSGKAWQLKARKLITVTCFYECTYAIDRKLYRDAFVWAMRGVKRGTTTGAIGNVSVKSLFQYLDYAKNELKNTPMVKNTSPADLMKQIDDYEGLLAESKMRSAKRKGAVLLEKLKKVPYKLIEGPAMDNNGRIFVKVSSGSGNNTATIVNVPLKGWKCKLVAGYFSSWQQCASAIFGTEKVDGNT